MNKAKKILFSLLFFGIFTSFFAQGKLDSGIPRTISIDGKALFNNYKLILSNDKEKVVAIKLLLKKADKLVKEEIVYSVMNKKQSPPSGDKHD